MRLRLILPALLLTLAAPSRAVEAPAAADTRRLVSEWLENSSRFTTLQIEFAQERQLRALRRPLSRQGKLWVARDGRLRWQIDDPPSLLLLRPGANDDLLWLDLKKRSWRRLDPDEDATQGNAQALRLLQQAQAASLADFEAAFTLRSARPVADFPGRYRLELDLRDRRASLAVKDVFFEIEPATGALHLMEFQLRDGSLLRTRVTRVAKNVKLDPALFVFDLAGLSETQ